MKGRTRSFFEDVFVLLIVAGVLIAGYYFFFSGENKKEPIVPTTTVEKEQTLKQQDEIVIEKTKEEVLEDNSTIKNEDNISTVVSSKELNLTKQIPQENEVIKNKHNESQDKEIVTKKVDPNRIAHLVKNVDLKLLKQFKKDVKEAMQNNIVLDETKDIESQNFSLRVTVLKNGEYEQMVFTGGDKTTFEKNQENILKVFPVTIDPKIEQDFPRYLRYSFKFNKIEN